MTPQQDRKTVLLRAAYDILTRAGEDGYVKDALSLLAFYDEANCDGFCLREDIAIELDIDELTPPIPLAEEES